MAAEGGRMIGLRTYCGVTDLARRLGTTVETLSLKLERHNIQPNALLTRGVETVALYDVASMDMIKPFLLRAPGKYGFVRPDGTVNTVEEIESELQSVFIKPNPPVCQ
jgi:hypothetical protein